MQAVGGLDELLDENCKDQNALMLIKYIVDRDELLKVLDNQHVLITPIVRNGSKATAGYKPDVWKSWE